MRRGLVATVGALTLLAASLVLASEESTLFYSRGLVEFHAGRFKEALERFDRGVDADGDDAYALYYRAVTRSRLNDPVGAIDDLQHALTVKPDLDQAALDLGVALVEANRYEEAIPWLQQAQRVADLEAQASLFLGIAQLRLGRFGAARTNLERASTRDVQLTPTARYYAGVADFSQHRFDSAEFNFKYVINARPNSQIATESKDFLEKIRIERAKDFDLFGAVGFQYDSNVILAASGNAAGQESALGVSNQADGRATINVGGDYLLGRADSRRLIVGYSFYQSLHFQLSDFNLQDHHAEVEVDSDAGPFQFGILGTYDYYFLKTDAFLREGAVNPVVTLPEGTTGRTELWFRLRRRDFLQARFHLSDAINYAPGITQIFYLGARERFLRFGYQWAREDTTSSDIVSSGTQSGDPRLILTPQQLAYHANQLGVAFGWTLPAGIETEVDYDWRHEVYAPESLRRRDDRHSIIVVARKPITEHLTLSGGYFGLLNNSIQDPIGSPKTIKRFDYERHIASITLEVRF